MKYCKTNSIAIFLMQYIIVSASCLILIYSSDYGNACPKIICKPCYSNGSSRYLWTWYLCNVLKYSLFSFIVAATLLRCLGFSLLYLMAWSSPVTAVRHDVSQQDLWYINTWFKWRNWLVVMHTVILHPELLFRKYGHTYISTGYLWILAKNSALHCIRWSN